MLDAFVNALVNSSLIHRSMLGKRAIFNRICLNIIAESLLIEASKSFDLIHH